MAIQHKTPALDKPALRKFGIVMGSAVSVLFGLLLPLIKTRTIPLWPWAIAGVFWAFAAVLPQGLSSFYKIWMRFGLVLGKINSRIILGIFFFLVITPTAFVLRLFRRKLLDIDWDKGASTYRRTSPGTADQQRYQNPY